MKRIYLLLFICTLFTACSSGPADVAESFTQALADGNVEEAQTYGTQSTNQLLEMAASMGGVEKYPDWDFKLVKEEVDGNKAIVTYMNAEGEEDKLELIKVEGDWKVNLTMDK